MSAESVRRRPRPASAGARHPFDLWTRANAGEVLPGLISPLAWSSIGEGLNEFFPKSLVEAGFKDAHNVRFATLHQGRLFFNVGALYHYYCELGGAPSSAVLRSFGGPAADQGLPLPDRKIQWGRLLRHLPATLKQSRRLQGAPKRLQKAIPAIDREAQTLAGLDLTALDTAGLYHAAMDAVDRLEPYLENFNDCNSAAFANYGSLAFLLETWLGEPHLANDLVAGLEMTKTAEGSAELWRIARKASARAGLLALVARGAPATLLDDLSADPAGSPFASDLRRFLAVYGHRAADELDIMNPRWVEDPAPIMAVFKSYVLSPPPGDPSSVTERQRQVREAAEARVKRLLRRRIVDRVLPWKWMALRNYIRQAQTFVPLREDPKFHLLKIFVPMRRCYLELGRRFVEMGALDAPQHVFHMYIDEIEDTALGRAPDPGALRETVRQRLADHERWSHLPIPWALGPDEQPLPPPAPEKADGRVLHGLAASSGRATGLARVITDLRQADEMREGEILVAPFTDPGWTPLFPLSAAIVTDLGGLLSHGAVVAREYGVPAVVNTGDATTVIRTGDRITVDGSEGRVYVET